MKLFNTLRLSTISSLLLISTSVFAHTHLEQSIPANEQVVKEAPTSVQLNFNGAVRLLKFELKTDKDLKLDLGFKPTSEALNQFEVAVPGLQNGAYTVDWTVIGEDGHTVANSFFFVVDPSAEQHAHGHSAEGHGTHSVDEAHSH